MFMSTIHNPRPNKRIAKIVLVSLFFSFLYCDLALSAGTVKMRVVIVNPSTTKTQKKSIKKYLPKEIILKNILDNGGLDVDYDQDQGVFYAAKNDIELAPSETKTFELVMEDVWSLPTDKTEQVRNTTNAVMERLKSTAYFDQADLIAKSILARLEDIEKSQNDPSIPKQQRIANFRDNVKVMQQIKDDLDKLQKILVTAGGPPNVELIEKSDINLKSPSSKTTWVVIFIVLIFVGILSGTFYFTWMRQASLTENIFTKEKEESFSEFKTSPGPKLDEPGKKP